MQFSLRTLVGATAVAPPLLAAVWFWGGPALLVLAAIVELLLAIAIVMVLLAMPLAIPFALAGLFWLVQKSILWLVGQVFDERSA